MNHDNLKVVFGPPGTGKTTYLIGHEDPKMDVVGVVEKAIADGVRPSEIAFFTFTRKAAEEAKTRAMRKFELTDKDLPWFRTIHSMVFARMGYKRQNVVEKLAMKKLGQKLGLDLSGRSWGEDGLDYGVGSGEKLVYLENLGRVTTRGFEAVWCEQDHQTEVDIKELAMFSRAYTMYKKALGIVDYTDMLDEFVRHGQAPNVRLLIVDEGQDLSVMQWRVIDKVAAKCDAVYVAGDDDQCSVAGSVVQTSSGEVVVEKLDTNKHRLICWDQAGGEIVGVKEGSRFKKQERLYSGDVVKLSAGGTATEVTADHISYVRWADAAKQKNVVYLMRQGSRWRVGWCQLFNAQGALHLNVRARVEKADGAWILVVCDSKKHAYQMETIIATSFGLPQIPFEPAANSHYITRDVIDAVFVELEDVLHARALNCLQQHGLLEKHPLYNPSITQKFGSLTFKTRTANVLSDLMLVPLRDGKKLNWCKVTTSRRRVENEKVYGLEVDKYSNYVADGIVTHNCIYQWAGADVGSFLHLEGDAVVLDQSYRISAASHKLATSVVSRIHDRKEKIFKPRPSSHGVVKFVNEPDEIDLSKGTWLLLARNTYMLNDLEQVCFDQGVNFDSPGKGPRKEALLKNIMTWEGMRKGREAVVAEVLELVRFLARPDFPLEGRRWLKDLDPGVTLTMGDLKDHGLKTDHEWYEALALFPAQDRDYFRSVRARGEKLLETPRVKVATIHGVKGGEADHVLLMSDISFSASEHLTRAPDDEARVFYVGLTRARENMFVVAPRTDLYYDI